MNLLTSIFGENEYLLTLDSFKTNYILSVKNTFRMGIQNPEITLETKSNLFLEQAPNNHFMYNSIQLEKIVGFTEAESMKPYLDQSLALADISKIINFKRNLKGKFLSIENMETIWRDWRNWKVNHLKNNFPSEKEQIKFVSNYEKGLEKFEDSIKNNLQYLFLLPELYTVIYPPNKEYNYLYSPQNFKSRLTNDLVYPFQMKIVKLTEEENETLNIVLHSILNKDIFDYSKLNSLYENNEFTINDFKFKVEMNYIFDTKTSKIISGDLLLIEQLHDNLAYTIKMNLENN